MDRAKVHRQGWGSLNAGGVDATALALRSSVAWLSYGPRDAGSRSLTGISSPRECVFELRRSERG